MAAPPPMASPDFLLRWPTYVLGELWRRGLAEIDDALANDELTLREYLVLVWIAELRDPSQQQVADRVGVDRSDFVKLLDRLQDRELIMRERDPGDRRRHVLSLTDRGRTALEGAIATSAERTAHFFAALSASELTTMHRLALKALGEDPSLADAVGPGSSAPP